MKGVDSFAGFVEGIGSKEHALVPARNTQNVDKTDDCSFGFLRRIADTRDRLVVFEHGVDQLLGVS